MRPASLSSTDLKEINQLSANLRPNNFTVFFKTIISNYCTAETFCTTKIVLLIITYVILISVIKSLPLVIVCELKNNNSNLQRVITCFNYKVSALSMKNIGLIACN